MLLTRPAILLRAEGAALLVAAVVLFARHEGSWLLFALAFFAPDLAALGYLAGSRVGAAAYNAAHTTSLPAALGLLGLVADRPVALALALIWLAHIGFDRLLGYGLKYASAFKDTHLSRV